MAGPCSQCAWKWQQLVVLEQVRVREDEDGETLPLYLLCRRWIQNDPDGVARGPITPGGVVIKQEDYVQLPLLPPALPPSLEELHPPLLPIEADLPQPHREPPPFEVAQACRFPMHSLSFCVEGR